jgi:hypothetical protein
VPGPPACYRNADRAEREFGDLARRYAAAVKETDELGDAALAALDPLGVEGMEALEQALNGDASQAPEPVQAYFASLDEPPFAVDHDEIERGARALMRHGVAYAAATRQSLFWGYSNGAAIKPLAWTGEMRQPAAALRRLVETGDWLTAVISPGELRPHGRGWQATARVRLLHARVRAHLLASGRWDAAAWGAPLNRADSAFTLLEFTLMPLKLLQGMGFTFTHADRAAIYALWRFVGHLVGVPSELNPDGEAAAYRLLALRELTAGPPDQQSLELVRSLLDSNLEPDGNALARAAGRAFEALDRAVAWRNLPPGYAAALNIPPTPVTHTLPAIAAGFKAVEAVRRRVPGADAWLLARNERLIASGEKTLKRRVSLAARSGHK